MPFSPNALRDIQQAIGLASDLHMTKVVFSQSWFSPQQARIWEAIAEVSVMTLLCS
jgi:hypothetical protein